MSRFERNKDLPPGMYDYEVASHPIHEDARIAKALAELEKISRLEAAQQALIDELSHPSRPPASRSSGCKIISLKACRDALKLNGGRS